MSDWWKQPSNTLSELAEKQAGLFSVSQAVSAGLPESTHEDYVRKGEWKMILPGVYELTSLLQDMYRIHSDGIAHYLWSSDEQGCPQGVFGYSTAMDAYGLNTPLLGASYQMIVPPNFKPLYPVPEKMALHFEEVRPEDVDCVHGIIKVTKPLRSILCFLKLSRGAREELRRGLYEALREGLLTLEDIKSANLTPVERSLIDKLIEELPWVELDDGIG